MKVVKSLAKSLSKVPGKLIVAFLVGIALGAGGASAPVVQGSLASSSTPINSEVVEALQLLHQGCLTGIEKSQAQRAEDLESAQQHAVRELESLHAQQLAAIGPRDDKADGEQPDLLKAYENAMKSARKDYESELKKFQDRSSAEVAEAPKRCEGGLDGLPRPYRDGVEQDRANGNKAVRDRDKSLQERTEQLESQYLGRARDLRKQFVDRVAAFKPKPPGGDQKGSGEPGDDATTGQPPGDVDSGQDEDRDGDGESGSGSPGGSAIQGLDAKADSISDDVQRRLEKLRNPAKTAGPRVSS